MSTIERKRRSTTLRIGNAGGYWGDDPEALERQVRGGQLDYVTMDFLAEITMSIMQKQRSQDSALGYARDFIPMLSRILPDLLAKKTRIITNAGGVNPAACAAAISKLAQDLGLKLKIAVVHGDDILPKLPSLRAGGAQFDNMESGAKFAGVAERVMAANVYFGAAPVVAALRWEPDIIVTGRVTDTGITLAAMIHEFGWDSGDWDRLASGIVAGHIIECGSQSTGGNFTDWRLVSSWANMGYPIVEVEPDGSFVVTKHPNTGGLVSVDTVREQLFYEMGNPKAYITPDVVADFSTIKLAAAGKDRVRVHGVKGYEPTALYKVSMAYGDGFKANGAIVISGPDARAKAEAFAEIFWAKAKHPDLIETSTEYFGWNACHRSLVQADDGNEIMLRLGARAKTEGPLKRFGKLIPALILGGPPGVCVLGGVPKPQEVVSYWPALMPKSIVRPEIARFDDASGKLVDARQVDLERVGSFRPDESVDQTATAAKQTIESVLSSGSKPSDSANLLPLSTICLGRSGDKGDTANIGVLARSPKAFAFIEQWLTAQLVKDFFQEICHGRVVRYKLPGLSGLNFLLEESLGGGGTVTLRTDAQGKTFAQALLAQHAPIPADVLEEVRSLASKEAGGISAHRGQKP